MSGGRSGRGVGRRLGEQAGRAEGEGKQKKALGIFHGEGVTGAGSESYGRSAPNQYPFDFKPASGLFGPTPSLSGFNSLP
jgi:hypothetical protein